MSLNHLSIEWQRWLRENVVRGCSRESLLLVQGGHAPVLAERALDEALGEPLPVPIAPSASDLLRPAPLLDANHACSATVSACALLPCWKRRSWCSTKTC
jgi:hypothetical protein